MNFIISLTLILIQFVSSSDLIIRSIFMRHLKKNDIGLMFDASIYNVGRSPRETLTFSLIPEKCCLQIGANETDCQFNDLIGISNVHVEPETNVLVTLVWPTLVLYNRVGVCHLTLSSTKINGEKLNIKQNVTFNTSINPSAISESLIVYFNDMKVKNGYTTCDSPDLNPFEKCQPENCELKYFGKRNYFNKATEMCDPVPVCQMAKSEIYDYQTNKCEKLDEPFNIEAFEAEEKSIN